MLCRDAWEGPRMQRDEKSSHGENQNEPNDAELHLGHRQWGRGTEVRETGACGDAAMAVTGLSDTLQFRYCMQQKPNKLEGGLISLKPCKYFSSSHINGQWVQRV